MMGESWDSLQIDAWTKAGSLIMSIVDAAYQQQGNPMSTAPKFDMLPMVKAPK